MRTRFQLQLDGRLCFFLALMLLLLPLPWVLAAIVAAGVHEGCHAAAIRLMNGRIYGLQLGACGIRMETSALTPVQEMVVAVAGPLGSAALSLLSDWMPRMAICGVVHCIFNLLPLFPLDGGRIIKNALVLCLPEKQGNPLFEMIQRVLRCIILMIPLMAGLRWGLIPSLIAFLLLLRQWKPRTV